ncbi:hypothetical protein ACSBR1_015429 [Camellia fascicularis]
MAKMFRLMLLCSVSLALFLSSSAQSCAKYAFASNKVFSSCNDLPCLNSFLHWTYNPSSGTVQIAYRHTQITTSNWVAWAINPQSKGMVGSQALVAFQKSDGTMSVYTAPVTSYQTQLQKGDLSFGVSDLSATYSKNEIVIFATLQLANNSGTVNQVWQDGPVKNDAPGMHVTSGPNIQSMASLNFLSGQSGTAGGGGALNSRLKKKNVFALFLRPKKEHKYRSYWNIYHHLIGYAIIILGIMNIFRGFNILNPEEKWERAYIIFLVTLAAIAAFLEVYTWIVVVKRKKSGGYDKTPHGMNGTNGFNGCGARAQHGV